jgi:guanylate kinase
MSSNPDLCLVVSAPSGAGKTTIIRTVIAEDEKLGFSISTTTRLKRPDDIEGESYYFISREEFKNLIDQDEFIEWAEVHGNLYGTMRKEIDRIRALGKIPLFDIDVQGGANLKSRLKSSVLIFIIPPSLEILEQILRNRKTDSEEQIKIRLANAIGELAQYGIYDYILINNNLTEAVNNFKTIVAAELMKTPLSSEKIKNILARKNDNTFR